MQRGYGRDDSRRPHWFAAIVLVAAHHKAELRVRIAEALKAAGTRIYVLHSDTDGTCPLRPEQELWSLLGGDDNRNLNINRVRGYNHNACFTAGFCEGIGLYRMMLTNSLPPDDTLP